MGVKGKSLKGEIYLFICTILWGGAIVAQSMGSDLVEAFTFNCLRSLIGSLVLVPVILYNRHHTGVSAFRGDSLKVLLRGGIICGFLLAVSINLQQLGVGYVDTTGLTEAEIALQDKADVGKVGFLTAMYLVIVPILEIFMGKKARPKVYINVVLAVAGMYLLCIKEGFSINKGDLYVIACAFCFALQILCVDHYAPKVDCVSLACVQFFSCGIFSAIGMVLLETPNMGNILAAWAPLLYMGVISCGVAYTFQVVGQKYCPSTTASLIMSLESVFSAVFGFLILGQTMSVRELCGCAVMLAAVLL